MKLLIIIPNLVLIAIAGVNLANELSALEINRNLAVIVLHFSVLIMCLGFVALVIRSMFKVVKTEDAPFTENSTEYEELTIRHTIQM